MNTLLAWLRRRPASAPNLPQPLQLPALPPLRTRRLSFFLVSAGASQLGVDPAQLTRAGEAHALHVAVVLQSMFRQTDVVLLAQEDTEVAAGRLQTAEVIAGRLGNARRETVSFGSPPVTGDELRHCVELGTTFVSVVDSQSLISLLAEFSDQTVTLRDGRPQPGSIHHFIIEWVAGPNGLPVITKRWFVPMQVEI